MPKKTLVDEWEAVKNDADTYCVGVEQEDGEYIYINKILEKGKLIGWRVRGDDKILANLPVSYDMTKYGNPVYLETGSFKKIAKEWEKVKKNSKAYYIAITDDDEMFIDIYIHKILKNGKLVGWQVKEKGKASCDLPADYDMTQFGFPGYTEELEEEDLFFEISLDPKSFTTPPLKIEDFVKNPAVIASIKRWEKEILRNTKEKMEEF